MGTNQTAVHVGKDTVKLTEVMDKFCFHCPLADKNERTKIDTREGKSRDSERDN